MKLVDVHCHLADEAFRADLGEILERASKQSVIAIITSTTSPSDIENSLNISARHPNLVFTSIGSDPSRLEAPWVTSIRTAVENRREKIIGIGEVGLDHYWVRGAQERDRQLQLFQEWIAMADEMHLPLTVHSRSAGQESLRTIEQAGYGRVLMHAYDGKVGPAMEAADRGIFFSIPTSVTHSEQKQKLSRRLPIESLMLESDAPVLPPVQGDRNEPANIVVAARKVAELKRIDVETVAEITSRNASRLFGISKTS